MSKAFNIHNVLKQARRRLETTEFVPAVSVRHERRTLAELNEANIDATEWTEAMAVFSALGRFRMH